VGAKQRAKIRAQACPYQMTDRRGRRAAGMDAGNDDFLPGDAKICEFFRYKKRFAENLTFLAASARIRKFFLRFLFGYAIIIWSER
jgi:hypothetical protein